MSSAIHVEKFTLWEFVEEIEKRVIEGYRLDLQSNEGFPVGGYGMYRCQMHKTAAITGIPVGEMAVVVAGEQEFVTGLTVENVDDKASPGEEQTTNEDWEEFTGQIADALKKPEEPASQNKHDQQKRGRGRPPLRLNKR